MAKAKAPAKTTKPAAKKPSGKLPAARKASGKLPAAKTSGKLPAAKTSGKLPAAKASGKLPAAKTSGKLPAAKAPPPKAEAKKPAPVAAKKPAAPAAKAPPPKKAPAEKPAPKAPAPKSKKPTGSEAGRRAKGEKVLAHMVGVLDHLGDQTTDASLKDELQGAREELVRTFENITSMSGTGLPAPATAEAVSDEASDESEAIGAAGAAGASTAVGNDDDEDQDDAASSESIGEDDDSDVGKTVSSSKAETRPAARPEPTTRPPRESPLIERRGIVDPYGNDDCLMVLAPVEAVARTFVELRRAPTWERDAFGREVKLTATCFSILRLRGHRWTTIVPELVRLRAPGAKALSADEAQELSRKLETRALWAAHGVESGYVGYAIFDGGELVERMVSGEPRMGSDGGPVGGDAPRFQSRRRNPEETKIEDPAAFADAVLVEEDALLLPGGSFRSMGSPGEQRQLGEGLAKGDVERLDYVAQEAPRA